MKKTQLLSNKERPKLLSLLNWLEKIARSDYGLNRMENGFANAQMVQFDNDIITIELRHGIVTKEKDREDIELFKVVRKRLLDTNIYELAKEVSQNSNG